MNNPRTKQFNNSLTVRLKSHPKNQKTLKLTFDV